MANKGTGGGHVQLPARAHLEQSLREAGALAGGGAEPMFSFEPGAVPGEHSLRPGLVQDIQDAPDLFGPRTPQVQPADPIRLDPERESALRGSLWLEIQMLGFSSDGLSFQGLGDLGKDGAEGRGRG